MKAKLISKKYVTILVAAMFLAAFNLISASGFNGSAKNSKISAAQVDYFLKIKGIDGESQDKDHKGEIEIDSYKWGLNNEAVSAGRKSGKPSLNDFTFTARVNKSTPILMQAAATGRHFEEAILTVQRPGDSRKQDYFIITLKDIHVSAYQTSGSGDTIPTDQVSLNFTKIEQSYYPQKADGSLDSPVKGGYDVKSNKQE